MRAIKTVVKTIAFLYDFTVDGGIGVFRTGLQPAQGSVLLALTRQSVINGVAGGLGATVSLGFNSNPTLISTQPAVLAYPSAYMILALPVTCTGEEIIFTISVNAFTAGKIKYNIDYYESKI